MDNARTYAGKSLAERQRLRRSTLIDVCLDAIHEVGLSEVSVRTVCSRANLTQRYFYESFANLDDLLVAVVDHVGDAAIAIGSLHLGGEVPRGDDLGELIEAMATSVYGLISNDPRKGSLLLAASAHNGMHQRLRTLSLGFADLMASWLAGSQPQADIRVLRSSTLFFVGGSLELISASLTGLLDLTEAEVIKGCTDLSLAGLSSLLGLTRG